jgi:hypothetical protein
MLIEHRLPAGSLSAAPKNRLERCSGRQAPGCTVAIASPAACQGLSCVLVLVGGFYP